MRISLLVSTLLLVVGFLNAHAQGFAVIELFTSQGCSSCPAADENLSKILKDAAKKSDPVFGLSFHVDYWNRLGWKDPYSSKLYTARQRAYANIMKLESVYTPQMIVNGRYELIGSNTLKSKAIIAEVLGKKPPYDILVNDIVVDKTLLTLNFTIVAPQNGETVNIALVEKRLENYVARGENSGKTLHHNNVVLVFKTQPLRKSNAIQLDIPNIQDLSIVLYIQDANYHTLGATSFSF